VFRREFVEAVEQAGVQPAEGSNVPRGRKLWIYIFVALGVSVGAIVAISFATMDHSTFKALSRIELLSFVVVIMLVVGRWFGECLRYSLVIKAMGKKLAFKKTSKAVLGSAFAGTITPFRSGSFPTQVFFFTRYGLTGGEATAVSVSAGAISMLVMMISMPIALIVGASKVHIGMGFRTVLMVAAVILFIAFVFALASMKDPSRVPRILRKITPSSIRRKQKFESFEERLTKGMGDFSGSVRTLLKAKKRILVAIVLLTVFFWFTGLFTVCWILRGLGFSQFFWKALLCQMLVSSILPFTPVPAESGIAELAFAGVFSIFIPKSALALVTMSWRFFMFYLPLAGLGVFFILAANDSRRIGKEQDKVRWDEMIALPLPMPLVEPLPEEA
jgi:uncharacterized protein (TIRG00374 family)